MRVVFRMFCFCWHEIFGQTRIFPATSRAEITRCDRDALPKGTRKRDGEPEHSTVECQVSLAGIRRYCNDFYGDWEKCPFHLEN